MFRMLFLVGVLFAGIYVGATVPAVRTLLIANSTLGSAAPADARKGDEHGHEEGAEAKEGAVRLSPAQVAAARIEVAQVSGGNLARRINVPGAIVPAADRVGRVAAKVVGTVSVLRKQLGDRVQKDEVVAELESREVADAKSEYLAANVGLELQRTLFERERSLYQKNIIPEQQFLRARSTFTEAQLRFDLTRQKLFALGVPEKEVASLSRESVALQKYELRSPMAGRIVERLVSLGAPVGGEGQLKEVYGIADLSNVWVELSVTARDAATVTEGQQVELSSTAPGETGRARIIFKSPLLTSETRSARVIAELSNADGRWQPGAFVSAAIIVEQQAVDLLVPKAALQTVGGEQVVFVRTPDGFEKREVALGRSDSLNAEVVFGLDPGEEIAVRNSFTLKAELGKAEASHAH